MEYVGSTWYAYSQFNTLQSWPFAPPPQIVTITKGKYKVLFASGRQMLYFYGVFVDNKVNWIDILYSVTWKYYFN